MQIQQISILALSAILITGCITTRDYVGIEPLYPIPDSNVGHANFETFPVVESLQPTIKWKGVKVEGFSYDLAVWERPDSPDFRHIGINYNDPQYYVEDIKDTEYQIQTPLKPDTVYMWTVRTRKNGETGQWASYKELVIMPGGSRRNMWNVPFSFKTP